MTQNVTSQNVTNQKGVGQNEKGQLETSDHEAEGNETLRSSERGNGERVRTGVLPTFREFTSRLFGQRLSKGTAKNRLQMVLIQDRSGLSSQDMDLFRRDLMDVISRYFVLERTQLEIEWKRDSNATALIINTPVVVKPRQVKKVAVAS